MEVKKISEIEVSQDIPWHDKNYIKENLHIEISYVRKKINYSHLKPRYYEDFR